jgi:hypothetical protein
MPRVPLLEVEHGIIATHQGDLAAERDGGVRPLVDPVRGRGRPNRRGVALPFEVLLRDDVIRDHAPGLADVELVRVAAGLVEDTLG